MKKCSNPECRFLLTEANNFCPKCGRAVDNDLMTQRLNEFTERTAIVIANMHKGTEAEKRQLHQFMMAELGKTVGQIESENQALVKEYQKPEFREAILTIFAPELQYLRDTIQDQQAIGKYLNIIGVIKESIPDEFVTRTWPRKARMQIEEIRKLCDGGFHENTIVIPDTLDHRLTEIKKALPSKREVALFESQSARDHFTTLRAIVNANTPESHDTTEGQEFWQRPITLWHPQMQAFFADEITHQPTDIPPIRPHEDPNHDFPTSETMRGTATGKQDNAPYGDSKVAHDYDEIGHHKQGEQAKRVKFPLGEQR